MTDSNRFQRLQALFHELEALGPEARQARLEALAAEDSALHAELVRLLEPDDRLARDEQALDSVAGRGGMAASIGEFSPDLPSDPEAVGPYRLVRLVGEGGMGRVYLAEQDEPVRRRAALKLTRRGLDSQEAMARFRAERQALAVLEHPNIARVFDAGSLEDGRPWFAMEYIEGVPITDWAAERQLGLAERIELLLPVCEAVQHAHRKGLIHRDLKPSNILVVDDGGQPVPKVIDFGIARVLEGDADDRTQVTRLGELIGTPEYMSPEQAALGEVDIDTRSDVYSLGLVLYELLVGTLPMTGRELRALGFEAMCRQIREGETPRPSRVQAAPETLSDATTQRWRARLKGDLDSVLLKALAKDRERRYGSAADLADDLKRYLANEPVVAQPPSLRYRAGKFIRRHRWPVAATAAVGMALIGGAVVALFGLQQARESEQLALAAAEQARAERETAEKATAFMVELFQAADPRENAGSDPTARELLERGRERVDELDDAPAVRVRLLESLGEVYWSLGDLDGALELISQGIAEHRAALLPDSRRLGRMLGRLGAVHRDLGELAEAERYFREALNELEAAGTMQSQEAGFNLNQLAIVLSRTERFDEAVETYRRALEVTERLGAATADDSLAVQQRLNVLRANMAVVQYRQGDLRGAADSFEQVLAEVQQELPPTHPYIGTLHNNLANAYQRLGHRTATRMHAEQAVEIDKAASGERHPSVADSLLKLGQALQLLGNYDAAEAAIEESREILVENRGAESIQVAMRDYELGMLQIRRGEWARALTYFEVVIERAAATPDLTDRQRASHYRNLAMVLRGLGRTAEADQAARRALALAGDEAPARGERTKAKLALALLAADLGDNDAAGQWLDAAMQDDQCAIDSPCDVLDYATTIPSRAAVLARMGRTAEAFSALEAGIRNPGWHLGMLQDPDLQALRGEPQWMELQKRFQARVEADRRDGRPVPLLDP
ncbi:serine/threonine protein kinase [Wenzhouxiangella sp. XN79A]|uniref:serine/threonine-protein kinase n=1 Tax=Wenzhouxiangella sp. XN79A TaxID=2724193 RepID=UPI00144A88FF|nr:serine/threonine-protein kinase [Wenzhouxiangella sp. XN79A]NKI34900.1 serine/threonine protein kinase [Wenzhouxiangella sp. XN79A]